jgi:anti-sigma B factor antagonist
MASVVDFKPNRPRSRAAMTKEKSHLSIANREGVSIVEFAERKILDELCISEIRDELAKLVADTDGVKLLVCFKNVDHLSSAALGVLITLNKQVSDRQGTLKLSDISPQIYEVFKITRLNKLFDIYDTAEQALSSF